MIFGILGNGNTGEQELRALCCSGFDERGKEHRKT
jgi:hypothetical protein